MHYPSGLKRIADQEHQDNARTEIIIANTLAIETNQLKCSRIDRGTI
jgi:hypothetical protein